MSEKSYRSNPRRQIIQSLGTDVSSEPVKKIGRYSYGSRKGLDDSQTSLSHEKVEPLSGYDNTGERDSMKKERIGSRERLSDKGRDRYSRDRRSDSDEDRYGRDRDRRSDSDEDYDRDRSSDRKRRSSRERDRRRSGRYSDEDSDYDRDQDYRRRRRRSYDRYSDDSDYENERERRRRSREGYSRERYDDQDNSDTDIDRGRVDDRDKPSYRRDSKERGRDRYSRERYDTDDDTEKSRDRGRDSSRDKDRSSYRRDSRERDRDRYVDLYDEDMGSKGGLYVDGYDDKPARQKSDGKRRGTSAERNSSRNGNRRSRSREYIQSRERDSPPLPLPPPYTEIDVRSIEPSLVESKRATQHQNLPPSPPFVATQRVEKQYPAGDDIRHTDKRSHKQSSVDRYKEPQVQKPSSSVDRYKEPQSQKRPPSEDRYREPQVQKPPPSEDRYREPQVQKPSPSAPPSEDGYREPQVQKPPPSEDRYREPHIRKSPQPVADTQQIELTQKQPPKEVDEVGRRRNTDNRRERYSRSRWTPKSKTEDAAPPDYEDVAPKSTFVGISYKEESV